MALSLPRTTTTRSSGKPSKRSEIPAPALVEVLLLLLHNIPECNRVVLVVRFTLKKKTPWEESQNGGALMEDEMTPKLRIGCSEGKKESSTFNLYL